MLNPTSYGDADRSYVIPYVPLTARSVLDIGCGSGWFLWQLRQQRPTIETWGIDSSDDPDLQEERMDVFLCGAFPETAPDKMFDVVVLNDVLEHLEDPWQALTRIKSLLNPGGVVVASIPNVRHYSVVKPLLVSGRWDYKDAGLLDRTHLRFFTRATAREMFEGAGLRAVQAVLETPTRDGLAARFLALGGKTTLEFRARHIVLCGTL